ncbi:hypothetical protein KSP40_PGU005672 [Platanthera guangdongensis]|uniref:Uncharacterized protein n=1 Tax=Platanthera guangdongensis TaxID=2320717 RepID=A0ABR2MAL9_9ASPA
MVLLILGMRVLKCRYFDHFSVVFSIKKKILAERIEERLSDSSPTTNTLHSYDPITNYTSPRLRFLRYNPNQRKQILRRIEGEKIGDEKTWSVFYPNNLSERVDEIDYEG